MESQSAEKLLEDSLSCFLDKKYEKALELVDNAIKAEPDFEKALFYKGVMFEETGKHDEAQAYYEKVEDLSDMWFNLGLKVEREKLGADEAIKYYKRATEINPAKSIAWYNMGLLYKKDKNKDIANTCFRNIRLAKEALLQVILPLGIGLILLMGAIAITQIPLSRDHFGAKIAVIICTLAGLIISWMAYKNGSLWIRMIFKKASSYMLLVNLGTFIKVYIGSLVFVGIFATDYVLGETDVTQTAKLIAWICLLVIPIIFALVWVLWGLEKASEESEN